jgi:hypothetical protein
MPCTAFFEPKLTCRLNECPMLDQPEFAADRQALAKLLE